MLCLGIDYGIRRVGVAVSDALGKFAFPHSILPNDENLVSAVAQLVREKNIEAIIVGDSRTVSGGENPITGEVEKFMRVLEERSGVRVIPMWEAWSSVEARRFTNGTRANDASAATIILQRYLDSHGV